MTREDIERKLKELEELISKFEIPDKHVITQPEMPYRGMIVAIKKRIDELSMHFEAFEEIIRIIKQFKSLNDFIAWVMKTKKKFEELKREFNKKLLEFS